MASVRPLTDLTVADLWREVKEPAAIWGDISQQTLRTVKLLLENRMHDELTEYLHAGRYVRDYSGRRGYRNGTYLRHLTTTWGSIPDLRIPRTRTTGFRPSVVARYQHRTEQVNRLVRAVFLGGLSTRRVGAVLAPLLGDTVSPATVSKITQALDQAVATFHTRHLADHYHYLFLDAVTLRVKTPDGTRRRHALVAYGRTATGQRELIDYRLVRQECQTTWEPFLINLACRGLTGATLRLITTDGHAGLHAALTLVYPHVLRQACWGPRPPQRRAALAGPRSRPVSGHGAPHLSRPYPVGGRAGATAVGVRVARHGPRGRGLCAARLGSLAGLLRGRRARLAPRPHHERD